MTKAEQLRETVLQLLDLAEPDTLSTHEVFATVHQRAGRGLCQDAHDADVASALDALVHLGLAHRITRRKADGRVLSNHYRRAHAVQRSLF